MKSCIFSIVRFENENEIMNTSRLVDGYIQYFYLKKIKDSNSTFEKKKIQ